VYQAFESLEDFETAIALLRQEAEDDAKGIIAKGSKTSEKSPL
jgi:transcriptional repressor NrdR